MSYSNYIKIYAARSANVSTTAFLLICLLTLSRDVNSLIHNRQQSTGAGTLIATNLIQHFEAFLVIPCFILV
jgi:hypothetical protein